MDELAGWMDVLGCPYCRGPLRVDRQSLYCATCDHLFPIQDGIPALVRHEDATALADSARRYRQARLRDGWSPMTPDQALALPYGSPPGYPPLYWEIRRQSYEALMNYLSRDGSSPGAGPAADLGAGTGWLAHRLAEAGYRALAVETSLEEDFGLGAARVYILPSRPSCLPIQGDLEHPPLRLGSLGLAIFNASLHYARDLEETVCRTTELLQEDGWLVILDTPVTWQADPGGVPRSPKRPRPNLGRQELEDALGAAGLAPRWISIRRGPRWWIYQVKKWLKGETCFNFPMIVAHRLG